MNRFLTNWVEGIEGAVRIVATLITPFFRLRRLRWGATDDEIRRTLPGDEYVPQPVWGYTHAVTIHAPAEAVWGWIVQLGQGRGGFYSYEGLENLVGCDIHNADRILPEFQHLKPGDRIKLHRSPSSPAYPVERVEPAHYILTYGAENPGKLPAQTWLLYLDAIDGETTRFIVRARTHYVATLAMKMWFGPAIMEPISFVMERKMMLGIKQRAERAYAAPAMA